MQSSRASHHPPEKSRNPLLPEAIRRNKKLIISVTLVVSILTGAYGALVYTPKYSSSASVVIKDSALTAKYLTNDLYSTTTSQTANPVLNTMELLKSDHVRNALWDEVIAKLPAERNRIGIQDRTQWELFFGDGRKFIKARNIPGTDVIDLSFQWPTAPIAQQGLETVLDAFRQASLEQNQAEHRQRYVYLGNQAGELKRDLAAVREHIAAYKRTHRIYDLNAALMNYERIHSDLDNASLASRAEAQNYHSQLSAYQKSLGMNARNAVKAVAIGRSTTLSQLYEKLYKLSGEKNAMLPRYTEEHPKVKQLESQITQTRRDIHSEIARNGITAGLTAKVDSRTPAAIADETRSGAVKDMLDAEAKYKGSQAQSAQLRNALSDLEAKMERMPQAEATLSNLKQEESSLGKALDALEEKRLEARMREAQTLSNVFVLSKPTLPANPQFPDRLQLMLLGVMAGLASGVSLAHARHWLSSRLYGPPEPAAASVSLDELLSLERQSGPARNGQSGPTAPTGGRLPSA